jgi:hypothetical protein
MVIGASLGKTLPSAKNLGILVSTEAHIGGHVEGTGIKTLV